MMGEDNCCGEP